MEIVKRKQQHRDMHEFMVRVVDDPRTSESNLCRFASWLLIMDSQQMCDWELRFEIQMKLLDLRKESESNTLGDCAFPDRCGTMVA